jgi:ubiquinone/menaquinone biosynthesis C-methylase UbiE
MTETEFTYTGASNLEVMQEAKRYNTWLVSLILKQAKSLPLKILDIGAGIGIFADAVKKEGHSVVCMEPDARQAILLQAKGFEVYKSLELVPDKTFDMIYALNVLEHIADDREALVRWSSKLKSGGSILIYVPAFRVLFSSMDTKVGHFRRYRRKELTEKVLQAGLQPEGKVRYADCLGFFAAWLYKLTDKSGDIKRSGLIFYDRFCFPLSRTGDRIFGLLFGKNVFVVAKKVDIY